MSDERETEWPEPRTDPDEEPTEPWARLGLDEREEDNGDADPQIDS